MREDREQTFTNSNRFSANGDVHFAVDGPFYNLKTAAEYCGYSEKTFSRILSEYEIPRFGPKKNRFAKSILTEWMRKPGSFEKTNAVFRRAPKMVTV